MELTGSARIGGSNRRFQFHKSRQFLIRTHNETLSVVAMCVSSEDRSSVFKEV
jgi:hypothetical protein